MSAYIRSAAAISPQNSFAGDGFADELAACDGNRFTCMEPDYRAIIDPKSIRRMGRIIRMSVAAALRCLNDAKVSVPAAIITGTAYGCLEDSGIFLNSMVELDEEPLAPTAFVHSTHNTIAAQIALLTRCHGYNNTFVNGGASFEHALTDALMLLADNEAENVLVGGMDELTDISYTILSRFGLYKNQQQLNHNIFDSGTPGTIAGEGAAFFVLANEPSGNDLAKLSAVSTFYKPGSIAEIGEHITSFLEAQNVDVPDIGLLITGKNGDSKNDALYDELLLSVFKDIPAINYKHLCGEYPTSSAFAMWLGSQIIAQKRIPKAMDTGWQSSGSFKKILIYNNYQNVHHSLILLAAC